MLMVIRFVVVFRDGSCFFVKVVSMRVVVVLSYYLVWIVFG